MTFIRSGTPRTAEYQGEPEVDALREGLRWLAQQLMEVEVSELIGAQRYERTPSRTTSKEGHWLAKVIDSDNADFIGDWTKYDGQAIYTYYRRWMREPERYGTGGRSFELDPILNPYRASALARQLREGAAVMQGRTLVHLGGIARQAVRVERAHPNGIREVCLVDLDLGLVLEWRELVNGETQAYLQIMRMEILPENMSLPQ